MVKGSPGGERWATVCVDHDSVRSNVTRANAVSLASCPEHWCRRCYENTGTRIWMATEEDLARDFPDGFVIGFPVGPSRPSKDNAEILVGTFTREEFLGEPERIDFPQPLRPKRRTTKPAEESD
jgi:hypothetical protein